MTDLPTPVPDFTPALQAIAERQQRGRIAQRLVVPVMLVSVGVGGAFHWWLAVPGLVALAVLQAVVVVADRQVCPLCRSDLLVRRGWSKTYATQCPRCGTPID